MSEYEGCYVKLAEDATFWLVEDGERRAMASAEEMLGNGLRNVIVVEAGVLEAIPIKGKRVVHHRDTAQTKFAERTEKNLEYFEKEEEGEK